MPPVLSQGDCVQSRGHAENCPQPHLSVRPFTTASSPLCHLPAQQGGVQAGSDNRDRPTATTAAKKSPEDQGARGALPHRQRRELQLSSCMDVLIPPHCDPRGSQQEARKWLSTEELQPSGSTAAVSRRPGEPHTKEDHARSETYSQIPAKSHYWAD